MTQDEGILANTEVHRDPGFVPTAVILVEGVSDQLALEALARRRGRDLAVERVIEAQDELASLRSLQNQPAWRGRNIEEQLRRFFGSKGNRKSRFGAMLVEAMDLTQVPRPLDLVLAYL
jgi:hypothetical protein